MAVSPPFICVHLGAGYHSKEKEMKYRKLSKLACESGAAALKVGGDAVAAVTAALTVLEDDPLCNAGYGSNLNIEGRGWSISLHPILSTLPEFTGPYMRSGAA